MYKPSPPVLLANVIIEIKKKHINLCLHWTFDKWGMPTFTEQLANVNVTLLKAVDVTLTFLSAGSA